MRESLSMRFLGCTVGCGIWLSLWAISPASAQLRYALHPDVARGIALYERGEFASALAILKPFVHEPALREPERQVHQGIPNAWAALYVARMLGNAQGAAHDRLAACAILKMAHIEFHTLEVDPRQPLTNAVRAEMAEMCVGIDEADVARWQNSCFADGIGHLEFLTHDSRAVVVDHKGIAIHSSQRSTEHEFPRRSCGELIVTVRHTPVVMHRKGVNVTRDFIEVFAWTHPTRAQPGERLLSWRVVEIVEHTVRPVLEETIATVPLSVRPPATLDPEIRDAVRLGAANGQPEWTITFGPTRRGSIK